MSRNIIAILRGIHPAEVEAIADTLIEAGISKIEVPLNSPSPYESIEILVARYGNRALIGAGTVLKSEEVCSLARIGARLIVSPDMNADVIKATKAAGMLSYPGVLTATECFAAMKHGADGLKIFPANVLGTEGVRALRAVLPVQTPIFAVGGAGPANFQDWLGAGVSGFGIGSGIYTAGMKRDEVHRRSREVVASYDAAMAASKSV